MGLAFERIVIVMLENARRKDVLADPYMNALRSKGVFLANSFGVTHPSQPNYIAAVAGDTFNIHNDEDSYVQLVFQAGDDLNVLPVETVVDLMERGGVSWKCYAEDLDPGHVLPTNLHPPYPPPPPDTFPYARKHVPFLSFPTVTSNPDRLARIVNAREFEADLAAGRLPQYSWYSPNLINDGHSTVDAQKHELPEHDDRAVNVADVAKFLQGFLGEDPIAKFPPETLIVITYDESYPYTGPYEVYTLLIGDMLQAGETRFEAYNHYSLLHTVELNFGLGTLRRGDAATSPYWFLRTS